MEKRLDVLYKDPKKAKFEIVKRFKGSDLKGMAYEPLFPYFADVHNHSALTLTFSARIERSAC